MASKDNTNPDNTKTNSNVTAWLGCLGCLGVIGAAIITGIFSPVITYWLNNKNVNSNNNSYNSMPSPTIQKSLTTKPSITTTPIITPTISANSNQSPNESITQRVETELIIGGSVSDKIGKGGIQCYKFEGKENTPLLFTIQLQRDFGFTWSILNSKKIKLDQSNYRSGKGEQFSFTPPQNDSYYLCFRCNYGFGEYTIASEIYK